MHSIDCERVDGSDVASMSLDFGGVKEQMARYLMFPSRLVAAVQGKWRTKSPLALENLQGSTAQQCCDRNLCVACQPNQS